jgi:lipopolysaccharide/colanic/teichoic acid biosynthesis glycosyltransferase
MAQPQPSHGDSPAELLHAGVADSTATGARRRGARQRLDEALKRALDLLLASLLLILLAPVMAVIAIAIRSTSPGPALFRQLRIGYRLGPFVMFKFRTMQVNNDDTIHRAYVTAMLSGEATPAEAQRGIYKLTHDPRVTSVGAFLRRSSLDELPQLFNALRGDMSLVGPRPALPYEAELFEERYRTRFMAKPGITGLWQVSGRSTLPMRQALELDVYYVQRRTIGLDLITLVRTIPAVLRARDAA